MQIIIRTCGERTTDECIRLANKQGGTHIIKAVPFSESIWQTYQKAIELDQEWTPVIDADVLLYDGTLHRAMDELNRKGTDIFCLDGKTDDKIFDYSRRAGVHFYRTSMLPVAMNYIQDGKLQPESHVRRQMGKLGGMTCTSGIVFGRHDYEQYYKDLWRKSVCQTQKLEKMIDRKNIVSYWNKQSRTDKDFKVIFTAHQYGKKLQQQITIDARENYGADEGLQKLGLEEKGEMI